MPSNFQKGKKPFPVTANFGQDTKEKRKQTEAQLGAWICDCCMRWCKVAEVAIETRLLRCAYTLN